MRSNVPPFEAPRVGCRGTVEARSGEARRRCRACAALLLIAACDEKSFRDQRGGHRDDGSGKRRRRVSPNGAASANGVVVDPSKGAVVVPGMGNFVPPTR